MEDSLSVSHKSANQLEDVAATKLQRAWRARRSGIRMDTGLRWEDAFVHAQLHTQRDAANEGRNDTRKRWKRVVFLAGRLQDQNKTMKEFSSSNGELQDLSEYEISKELEVQHWLELTDR